MGRAASKAKTPLIAGSAAAVGAAGGMALGMRQSRRSKAIGMPMRRRPRMMRSRPRVQMKSGDLARAARDVGAFGAQFGQLASELRKNREEANRTRHRSPVEVVLQGLTSRR